MAQAAQYYNSKVPNLGTEFLREVKHAVKRLEADPEAAQAVRGDVRRWLIRRFPFGILYRVDPGEIVILAVMHLARRSQWKPKGTDLFDSISVLALVNGGQGVRVLEPT